MIREQKHLIFVVIMEGKENEFESLYGIMIKESITSMFTNLDNQEPI